MKKLSGNPIVLAAALVAGSFVASSSARAECLNMVQLEKSYESARHNRTDPVDYTGIDDKSVPASFRASALSDFLKDTPSVDDRQENDPPSIQDGCKTLTSTYSDGKGGFTTDIGAIDEARSTKTSAVIHYTTDDGNGSKLVFTVTYRLTGPRRVEMLIEMPFQWDAGGCSKGSVTTSQLSVMTWGEGELPKTPQSDHLTRVLGETLSDVTAHPNACEVQNATFEVEPSDKVIAPAGADDGGSSTGSHKIDAAGVTPTI